MRRRILLAALAVLVVAGAFELWASWRPNPITQENYARIQEGMSRAEVEAILGPPADYTTGPLTYAGSTLKDLVPGYEWFPSGEYVASEPIGEGYYKVRWQYVLREPIGEVYYRVQWQNDTAIVAVIFDATDYARVKDLFHVERISYFHAGWLEWRAKRLWHRLFS
jgi:SmpA / OmlA family